jgi:hypothetical protein
VHPSTNGAFKIYIRSDLILKNSQITPKISVQRRLNRHHWLLLSTLIDSTNNIMQSSVSQWFPRPYVQFLIETTGYFRYLFPFYSVKRNRGTTLAGKTYTNACNLVVFFVFILHNYVAIFTTVIMCSSSSSVIVGQTGIPDRFMDFAVRFRHSTHLYSFSTSSTCFCLVFFRRSVS